MPSNYSDADCRAFVIVILFLCLLADQFFGPKS